MKHVSLRIIFVNSLTLLVAEYYTPIQTYCTIYEKKNKKKKKNKIKRNMAFDSCNVFMSLV